MEDLNWFEIDGDRESMKEFYDITMKRHMNIMSSGKYPANKLSNFAGHRFTLDNVQCNSMEGFLQSLKFKDPNIQEIICKLVGVGAKRRGHNKKWWKLQELYWRGITYKRDSEEYTKLIERAYDALYKDSEGFRKALAATNDNPLTHSIGKKSKHETILTKTEFIGNLYRLR